MKFTDGMWLTQEGYTLNWVSHVERVFRREDNNVDLLLVRPQHHIGDSINTFSITSTIRCPLEGVIAAKFQHWDGEQEPGPQFDLSGDASAVEVQQSSQQELRYKNGCLDLSVNTSTNSLSFEYSYSSAESQAPKPLTGHSWRSIGFASSRNTPAYSTSDGMFATQKHYMSLGLDLSVHEKIYGLGERFGPFVKNGQAIELWNEDGGTSSEQTYKNIPFYMSSRGYGVFINHPGKVMLEVQSERTTRVNIAVEGESLEYMVIAGPTPKDILNRYTRLTGRPPLPPAWSYGLWLTTSFQTSYTEDIVTSTLDNLEKRSIPLSVFHFDACWMKSFQWCDFVFDSDQFPDPKTYLFRLKARKLKLCVWMNPFVAQASALFAEGKKNHYFVMRADTPRPTIFQTDMWQAGMAIVDFTNPDACRWFASHLTRILELGIDSFKTDFGERIPFHPQQVKYHDGSDPRRMHNLYAYLYNKTVWECVQTYQRTQNNNSNPVLFARAATTGCQRFPVHWGGDCESTFPAMAETLRGGLSLSLSGFAFWAHDIGGFEGLPSPALYKRWVQFGLLSSHSRLHGSSSYRVPWMYESTHPGEDEKCTRILRDSVNLKLSLMPYLLSTALEANSKGTPVMRPMLMEFGHDLNVWTVDTQYMLGPSLLVAPVFDPSGEVRFYVPETTTPKLGSEDKRPKWRSWFDRSKTYEEGKWYIETHDFDTFPLLIRPGAVFALNPTLTDPEGDFMKGLQILVNGPLYEDHNVEIVLPSAVGVVYETIVIDSNLKTQEKDEIEVVNVAE